MMTYEELLRENIQLKIELERYKQRYELVAEASNDGLWDWEITTGKLYNSPRWKATLGYEDDELQASLESWSSRVHPDDLDMVMVNINDHIEGKSSIYKAEYRIQHKDGHYIWILDHGKLQLNEQGKPIRMAGSLTNISERKEKENLLRTVLNCMSEGILVMNTNGEFIYTNPSFCSVLGLSIDQIEGRTPLDPTWRVIHEDGSPYPGDTHPSWRTLQTGKAIHNDIQGVFTSDATLNWISANSEPLINPESKKLDGVVITFTDITEQRKMIEQLKEFNKKLEDEVSTQVNMIRQKDQMLIHQSRLASMGEMISMIAHQWRQPITTIGIVSNTILLDIEFDEVDLMKFKQQLQVINTQVEYLSQTIDDFRNFFRSDKRLQYAKVSLIIEEVRDIVKHTLDQKHIAIIFDIDQDLEIKSYKNEMQQVIMNIINNAADVLIDRKISSPTILIHSFVIDDERFQIDISDNGGGIGEDIIEKIFDPYFSTKSSKNGTGLGLYMSKTIVTDHLKGSLTSTNTAEGAMFTLVLPKEIY
jgi:PAS domain S-box-containing protein